MRPDPLIYWSDMLASAVIGWSALFWGARLQGPQSWLLFPVAVLALYRAALFIHELTHISPRALPGFTHAWNLLVGIPFMVPSFFYVGVHQDHHRKDYYGTANDPEYYPMSGKSRWLLLGFLLSAAAMHVFLAFRFLVLVPLGLVSERVRRFTVEKYSSLVINPEYVRRAPKNEKELRYWRLLEVATTVWCFGWTLALALGWYTVPQFLYGFGVLASIGIVNQLRTLVAHRFEHGHEPMTVEEQLLDSVNFPGPDFFAELWAPVGLRFHGLHHYLPGIPYHNLAEAHRRLSRSLPQDRAYHQTMAHGLFANLKELGRRMR